MYLALFLTPWILMYTFSTAAMNHRHWLQGGKPKPPAFELERELTYDGTLPEEPKAAAQQLLISLGLDGAHNVNRRAGEGTLVIQRQEAVRPLRITYTAADKKVKIERQVFTGSAFLERMHRRRGFQHNYALEDLWAFSVDFTIAAMIFWVLSGLWMWWEMKMTRAWGAACMLAGVAVFAFYVVAI